MRLTIRPAGAAGGGGQGVQPGRVRPADAMHGAGVQGTQHCAGMLLRNFGSGCLMFHYGSVVMDIDVRKRVRSARRPCLVWDSLLKISQDSDSLRCLLSGLSETLHLSAMTYV